MINFFQEVLEDEKVIMKPLQESNFDELYQAASDPLIWEQHPNKYRYQLPEFTKYFEGAIKSSGAYIVFDKNTNETIGSSRFYDYDENEKSVLIGYTFVIRSCWGKGYNQSMKSLMMVHAFKVCDKIYFHVGAQNRRSQIAMERLGGIKTREIEVAYYGEPPKINFEYVIYK
jgi:RimJ/RimL family protein N-acetyltransferase